MQQFNCAAATYDGSALLQKEISNRLLQRLEYIHFEPIAILDLGCGTGYCSLLLREKFPKAHIVSLDISESMIIGFRNHITLINEENSLSNFSTLVADVEFLPIADFSFDLIFSNFALEWMTDLQGVFAELKRVLKVNGLLMFSTYGLDSLAELRNGIESIEQNERQEERPKPSEDDLKPPYFRDMHNIGDMMLGLQYQDPVMDVEWLSMTYQNVDDIIKDLCDAGIYSRLELNHYLEHLKVHYEQYRQKNAIQIDNDPAKNLSLTGKLPVTYEIIYGHAWRQGHDEKHNACAVSNEDVYTVSVQSGFPLSRE
jgi:malonyl-CoA O-methyltransferase